MHALFKQNLVLCKELYVEVSLATLFFEAKYLFFKKLQIIDILLYFCYILIQFKILFLLF